MKIITKSELVKALGKKKLARLYCKGMTIDQVQEQMEKYPSIEKLDRPFQVKQVRTNDIIITNTISKVDYVCDTKHARITEIEFQHRIGYTIEFIDQETKQSYANVLYIV